MNGHRKINLALLFIMSLYLLLVSCNNSKCNGLDTNSRKIEAKADSLKKAGRLRESISLLRRELDKNPSLNQYYALSYSYSLINKKDSALYYLDIATDCDSMLYKSYYYDLYNISNDPMYDKILTKQLQKIEKKHGKIKNFELAKRLLILRLKDQAFYYQIFTFPDSASFYWKKKEVLNEQTIIEAESIIAKYGWPSENMVGVSSIGTIFLIIQHSGDISLMKKYLPLLEMRAKEENIFKPYYATYVDRIYKHEGSKQVYGTQVLFDSIKQVYYLDNVISPDSLNIRRKEMGLLPIEEYLKQWNAELRINE